MPVPPTPDAMTPTAPVAQDAVPPAPDTVTLFVAGPDAPPLAVRPVEDPTWVMRN